MAVLADGKVYRSADRGASWTEVGSGLRRSGNSLAISPQAPAKLYAGTDAGLFAITLEALTEGRVTR